MRVSIPPKSKSVHIVHIMASHRKQMVDHLHAGSDDTSLASLWEAYRGHVEQTISLEISAPSSTPRRNTSQKQQQQQQNNNTNSMSIRQQFQQATSSTKSSTQPTKSSNTRSNQLMMLSSSPNHNQSTSTAPPLPSTATSSASLETIRTLQQDITQLRLQLNNTTAASQQRETELETELETALERADLAITSLENQLATAKAKLTTTAQAATAAAVQASKDAIGTSDNVQITTLQEQLALALAEKEVLLTTTTLQSNNSLQKIKKEQDKCTQLQNTLTQTQEELDLQTKALLQLEKDRQSDKEEHNISNDVKTNKRILQITQLETNVQSLNEELTKIKKDHSDVSLHLSEMTSKYNIKNGELLSSTNQNTALQTTVTNKEKEIETLKLDIE